MKDKIWLSSPHMGGDEFRYIEEAFHNNWIAPMGPNVTGFEQDLCTYTGAKYSAALSCGTAALHLALVLLGVKPGDEVICSSFTHSASVNPIIYQGASPVFVDSEEGSWNMSPVMLQCAIQERLKTGRKPKAIIVVHLYGNPAPMDAIMTIAEEYDIPVVEDAADALGSIYKGKALGTFGLMGILSFNGNKIITTSAGGALISDNEELITRARFLSTQARDSAPHNQHSQIGYNYRMSNVCAGIGRGQMRVLAGRLSKRRENFAYYRNTLSQLPGVGFQEEIRGASSNRWLTCITIDPAESGVTREAIRHMLEDENIEARPICKPMHLQPVFAESPYYGNWSSELLFERGLCLPSGSNLNRGDLDRVINIITTCFERAAKRRTVPILC